MSNKEFVSEQENALTDAFNEEFPGALHKVLIAGSDDKLGWFWVRAAYLKGGVLRSASQEVSSKVLTDEARYRYWRDSFFSHIRHDLESAA